MYDTRCTPSWFYSEERITFIVLKTCSASAEVTGINCFHGALQFNDLFWHTRYTVVDEISEAILRRFKVNAIVHTTYSGAAGQQPHSQETRRAMRLTPDTAAASPESVLCPVAMNDMLACIIDVDSYS